MNKKIKWNHLLGSILLGTGLGLLGFSVVVGHNLLNSRVRAYVVTSGSMQPAIKVGSVVFTKSAQFYSQGDIITFFPNDLRTDPVTHRIVAKTHEDGVNAPVYLTSGDANEEIDKWKISDDQIIGKVELTIPYLGYIVNFAQTPKGFVALVIIPSSIIIYEELKTLAKELKRQIDKFSKKSPARQDPKYTQKGFIVVFPLFIVFLIFVSVSGAYYYDKEVATANTFGVAVWTPTPAPSPTIVPETLRNQNE